MCGIAGYATIFPHSYADSVIERMNAEIAHRGPDGTGYYRQPQVAFGHRRLSIIDVAGGLQPMTNESGTHWIIYNGEVFNHSAVRPALEKAGHRYRTRCDTETILHAYEEYGPDCVTRFRGMFAFAIWDNERRRLFCARDRLGIKPLYYYWDGCLFAFASEIKALLAHPAISPEFEDAVLPEYLAFGYTSDDRTMFRGIRKLMPGHHLTLDVSAERPAPEIRQYWDVPEPQTEERAEASWILECRERLEETVRMRLMSDVPLGMFLSGGVDSSAIAALMKRNFTGPVKTFAVGYEESEYSELAYARHVAETIGTEHHEVVVSMEDFFNALPRLTWHEDEPITWPSSVSLYFVSRLAREQVKVVLTGEGSDEMFGGYSRYRFYAMNERWLRYYRLLPGGLRSAIRDRVGTTGLISATARRKLQHTFVGRGEDLESLYLDNFYSAFSAAEQGALFHGLAAGSPYANFHRYWDARPETAVLPRLLWSDQKTYLVELLMKQDQMSMATSIESRVPFLDHTFVEFSTRVPDGMKLRGAEGKYIVKKAIEDLVPKEIIYRKKMGFPTPLREWLRDARAERIFEVLRARDGLLAGYIDSAALDALLEKQVRGQEDATDRIWRLLALQVWGDIWFTGKREERWEGLMAGKAVSGRAG